jgi:hypothetical protein
MIMVFNVTFNNISVIFWQSVLLTVMNLIVYQNKNFAQIYKKKYVMYKVVQNFLTTKPINIKKKNLLNDKCASDYTQDKMVDPHTNIKHYD